MPWEGQVCKRLRTEACQHPRASEAQEGRLHHQLEVEQPAHVLWVDKALINRNSLNFIGQIAVDVDTYRESQGESQEVRIFVFWRSQLETWNGSCFFILILYLCGQHFCWLVLCPTLWDHGKPLLPSLVRRGTLEGASGVKCGWYPHVRPALVKHCKTHFEQFVAEADTRTGTVSLEETPCLVRRQLQDSVLPRFKALTKNVCPIAIEYDRMTSSRFNIYIYIHVSYYILSL